MKIPKKSKSVFQKRENHFRKIFDYSNDAIFIMDPEGDKIIDANPKACEMLGYTHDELLSIQTSAIHPHEVNELIAFSRSVLKQGHGWTNELSCMTKSGLTLPSEISASFKMPSLYSAVKCRRDALAETSGSDEPRLPRSE